MDHRTLSSVRGRRSAVSCTISLAQKINQAVIKLTELDAKSAPVVELIDFAKKVDLVQKSAYAQTTENAKDKEFAKDVCSKAFTMNQYQRIVAHASFEPTGDGVQFSRAVTSKRGEVLPVTEPWTEADFTKCYAEMGALETDLDKLIELLKPTPKGWFFQNVDVINPPKDGPQGTLQSLLDGYQQSSDFLDRRERTKTDYKQKIKQIEEQFGDFPIAALSDRRSRGVFMGWRDQLALKSRRQADYAWQVLASFCNGHWTVGRSPHNPCARGGRLYQSGVRIEKIWTHEHEAAFLESAPAYLHLPLLLGLWTAQREGDLLALSWASYDGTHIRLKQSKTGARMVIPVGVPLKAALAATKKQSPHFILLNSRGQPWTSHAFQAAFGPATRKAGIVGLTFHDLRGSAITRLALAGCSEPEIATFQRTLAARCAHRPGKILPAP